MYVSAIKTMCDNKALRLITTVICTYIRTQTIHTDKNLQYILMHQYINTLIDYCPVILCSMNIKISKYLLVLNSACLMLIIITCVITLTWIG